MWSIVRDPYWYGDHHGNGGWWVLMLVMMVLFVAAAVALVVVLTRRPTTPAHPPAVAGPPPLPARDPSAADPYASAERTLAERFALGEIGEDEFRAKLAVLRTNTG